VRILIADDHALVRRGIRETVAEHLPQAEFGEADSTAAVLDAVWHQEWDLLILDLSMPGRGGLDVIRDVRQARPHLRVLVLSMHPEEHFTVRVLKAGASGYVSKEKAAEELVAAVDKVLTGAPYVSARMAERLVAQLATGGDRPPHERLSDREFQVFRALAAGRTVKEIAGDLSLSMQTVSTHRTRLLRKLGLARNAELLRYALDHGLVN
jgi:two-component system, NarL family, invasion response regulator UvrY